MSKQVQFSFAQVTELHQYLTGFVLHASCALGSRLLLQLFNCGLLSGDGVALLVDGKLERVTSAEG